jgi:TetR/AcrR family transcriptional repressor of mexJK operon
MSGRKRAFATPVEAQACAADLPVAPRLAPKRAAIEKAAACVFLRDGFAGASMDAIAREAGVSKATLYSHFQGKDDLFGAIVRNNCQQMLVDIESSVAAGLGPRELLLAVGLKFLKKMMSDEVMAVYRILVSEAPRFPALGRAVQNAGPGPSCNGLADYFRDQTAKGVLVVADPEIAADQFFGAILGGIHFRRLICVDKAATPSEIKLRVATAVEAFLAAHAPVEARGGARRKPALKPRKQA